MTQSIATLITRNLHEVFGEGDPQRRRSVIETIFTEDAAFYAPDGIHRGWAEIDQIAGTIRAMHPDFVYTPLGEPEDLHGAAGRLRWAAGRPGEQPVYAGTDFITVRDNRIAALYLFFDTNPA